MKGMKGTVRENYITGIKERVRENYSWDEDRTKVWVKGRVRESVEWSVR